MDLNSFVFQDVVCLSEVNFSVKENQSQLLKIPDCSTAACDGVPPTIYNRAADVCRRRKLQANFNLTSNFPYF